MSLQQYLKHSRQRWSLQQKGTDKSSHRRCGGQLSVESIPPPSMQLFTQGLDHRRHIFIMSNVVVLFLIQDIPVMLFMFPVALSQTVVERNTE